MLVFHVLVFSNTIVFRQSCQTEINVRQHACDWLPCFGCSLPLCPRSRKPPSRPLQRRVTPNLPTFRSRHFSGVLRIQKCRSHLMAIVLRRCDRSMVYWKILDLQQLFTRANTAQPILKPSGKTCVSKTHTKVWGWNLAYTSKWCILYSVEKYYCAQSETGAE